MALRILVIAAVAAHATVWHLALAAAQVPGAMATVPKAAADLSRGERSFVVTAGQAGMAEIALAKVAQQRGGTIEIQHFADRMIADHGKANRALTAIASAKGVAMPTELSGAGKRRLAKVKTLKGRAFDKGYLDAQVLAHKQAVSLYKRQADRGKDAELTQFASSTLPTLREHLKMVTSLSRLRH